MITAFIKIKTKGNDDIINITPQIQALIAQNHIESGIIFLSVIGSTAALTTMEYEPGLVKDLSQSFERLLPFRKDYAHNAAWSDDNGHSHLRSTFLKTNFFVSVSESNLDLGTWQQIVLVDFDTRSRERTVVAKIII
ncbi:MAG: secondary thiamine-phosphate synthase enzyme YjbQ [Candidatus Omnitrophica bacterium]|nr:secondary thiamine-phosphate synthase enzyme YjbQ [Candidatus Omnitrophota bacterium]MDD5430308.1 secondary thiamine-phosphate synthase enzyme YjbQ [Candidatus Omnitrophota bacterium]